MHGVPFRTAHEVLARAAATSEGTPTVATLDAVTAEVLGESLFEYVPREAVEAALDPAESVASRDSTGGPAPDAVSAALAAVEEGLAADRTAVTTRREALTDARETLDSEVATYV